MSIKRKNCLNNFFVKNISISDLTNLKRYELIVKNMGSKTMEIYEHILSSYATNYLWGEICNINPEFNNTYHRWNLEVPSFCEEIQFKITHTPKKIISDNERKRAAQEALDHYVKDFVNLNIKPITTEDVLNKYEVIYNVIRFFLYDPQGTYLGEANYSYESSQNIIFINSKTATSGLHPISINPGNWLIEIQMGNIVSQKVNFRIDIEFKPNNSYLQSKKNAIWKKGLFHVHSNHSDGKDSVEGLMNHFHTRGYDFFALTDHNLIYGWQDYESPHPISILPGIEMGAHKGHCLGIGIKRQIDWRFPNGTVKPINDLIDEVHRQGGVFGIAHPFCIDFPVSIPCHWDYEETDYGRVDFIEIWTYPFICRRQEIRKAFQFWDQLLNEGIRISGSSSIDLHDISQSPQEEPFPWMSIHCPSSNPNNLIESIRSGSFYSTNGPEIDLQLSSNSTTIILGETLLVQDEITLHCQINQDDFKGHLHIISDGKIVRRVFIKDGIPYKIKLEKKETPSKWLRTELYYDEQSNYLATFTNPFYID